MHTTLEKHIQEVAEICKGMAAGSSSFLQKGCRQLIFSSKRVFGFSRQGLAVVIISGV
jgi:hypothetical protein